MEAISANADHPDTPPESWDLGPDAKSIAVGIPSNEGELGARLYLPSTGQSRYPTVVHCPGWTRTMSSERYSRWHRALVAEGFAVFAFDYGGRGLSAQAAPVPSLTAQVAELEAAIGTAVSLGPVDDARIGVLGSGGPGGSHPIIAAAKDPRIRAIACQFPIASGRRWLETRLDPPTLALLLNAVEADRQERMNGAAGLTVTLAALRDSDLLAQELVEPSTVRDVPITVLGDLLEYEPIPFASRVHVPALIVAVDGDLVTPSDGARQLYDKLKGPRDLVLFHGVSHHGAYEARFSQFMDAVSKWFHTHLTEKIDPPTSDHQPESTNS